MSGIVKNVYALVNLAMAGFVMATVSVRFVFPAVSSEGAAFWIVRKAPISMRDFLWSKFWTGFVPVFVMTETLTVAANELLGVDPILKAVCAATILFLSFALVGMATGMGARYPRFGAENPTQVAGSYGGVTFMIFAVAIIVVTCVLVGWPSSVYLWHRTRAAALAPEARWMIGACFGAAITLNLVTWWRSMASGVRALEEL